MNLAQRREDLLLVDGLALQQVTSRVPRSFLRPWRTALDLKGFEQAGRRMFAGIAVRRISGPIGVIERIFQKVCAVLFGRLVAQLD